jgi:hypothetical protein
MIESLPVSTSDKVLSNPALMRLLVEVDHLESQLSACEVGAGRAWADRLPKSRIVIVPS